MDLRFARLEALLWNIVQDPKLPPKTSADFLPDFLGTRAAPQSADAMEAQMETYADSVGAAVLPPETTDADLDAWVIAHMQEQGMTIEDFGVDDIAVTFEEA